MMPISSAIHQNTPKQSPKETKLHDAARADDVDSIKKLVRSGYSIKETDHLGQTALHVAGEEGNEDAIRELVRLGCPVEAKNKRGQTVLHHVARLNGLEDLAKYLVEQGCPMDAADDEGHTALHEAAASGSVTTVIELLRLGCPNLPDKDGRKASDYNRRGFNSIHMMC